MMFKLSQVAGLVIFLSACAAPVFAQTAAARDEEAKAELYNRLVQGPHRHAEDQKTTYEVGKEYLRKYGEPEDEIVRYVRRWVIKYELEERKFYRRLLPRRPAGPRAVCRRSDP